MTDDRRLASARLERLRTHLADAPFDWLLVADPANVGYATGYRSVAGEMFRGHRMAALVGPDDLWLVGPCADAAPALDQNAVDPDRYVAFGRFYFESLNGAAVPTRLVDQHADFAEAVLHAAATVDDRQRVGVDGDVGAAICDAIPGRVVDATEWVYGVRAVKLPDEVELLARAAHVSEAGIERALAEAGRGVTERELAAIVAETMSASGGSPRFIVVTSGERSALADARPTDRAWRPGELLRFDVGCVVDGYWSDLGRTAVLGEPDPLQRTRYDAILAGESAQLAEIRPGMTAEALFDLAVDTVEEQGLRPYRRHHCGHAIGSAVYERPVIAPGITTEIQEGMVFCVETPFYELGWGGMMVEDTIVVTAGGCELLSVSDRALRVVAA
jgi:Xaa-Pro aminopeptidase